MRGMLLAALVQLVACLHADTRQCASGLLCPSGYVCDDAHGACVLEEQVEACLEQPELAACSYPGVSGGACYDGVCLPGGCGNEIVDEDGMDAIPDNEDDEACDDGNHVSGDGCSADCRSAEQCGNGYLDVARGEGCDDGNFLNGDGCHGTCATEEAAWTKASPEQSPPATFNAAMTYDAARGQTILFGGASNGLSSATWIYEGFGWRRMPTSVAPPPRQGHAMIYDTIREQVLLFGGASESGPLADSWTWNGRRWSSLPTEVAPPARRQPAMAYEPERGVVVLFGGLGDQAVLGDVWELDGSTWTHITPAGDSPVPRVGATLAYDPIRKQMILHGGEGAGGALNDTWTWDGAAWTELDAPSPLRTEGTAVFDVTRQAIAVIGGYGAAYQVEPSECLWLGDAWQCTTAAVAPTPTGGSASTFDALRGQLVVFGGRPIRSGAPIDETWLRTNAGWQTLDVSSETPSPREGHAMALDEARQQIVLFGGDSGAGFLDDTWIYQGGFWRELSPASSPPKRARHRMVYDSRRGVVVLHGGASGSPRDDTWEWNGSTWIDVTPQDPAPRPSRERFAFVYDPVAGVSVLFGGYAPPVEASTWTWDGSEWTKLTTTSSPSARISPSASYDPKRQRIVLCCGVGLSTERLADLWEWDGSNWSERTPLILQPGGREEAAIFYHPMRQRTVLFGGSQRIDPLNDTWEWDGTSWTPVPTASAPSPRRLATATWNPTERVAVLFGGNDGARLGDTWTYRFDSDQPEQACGTGLDGDSDGLVGCEDPDCWTLCSPTCPAGVSCAATEPTCGDGTCSGLETCRICPTDCDACEPQCGDYVCDGAESTDSCPLDC